MSLPKLIDDDAAERSSLVVSVIICTYQREETLRQTILDVLQQSFRDHELIIVDQTRTHELETEKFFSEHREDLRLIRMLTPNLPEARNVGIKAARGEIVLFVDDDIRLDSDILERILTQFQNGDVDALAPLVVDDRGEEVAMRDYAQRYGNLLRTKSGNLWPADVVIGACMAIRRSVILGVGGFDVTLGKLHRSATGEDFEFFERLSGHGYGVFVDPSIRVKHLGQTPGGCAVRIGDPSESIRAQLRALVYIRRKQMHKLSGSWLWIWLSMFRHSVLRRDLFKVGIAGVWRRVREIREAIHYVRTFLEAETSIKRI